MNIELDNTNKRIFIINHAEVTHVVGGATTIFVNMCNLFSNSGYEVYGICYSEIQGTPNNLDKKVNFINLKYYYDENFSYPSAINKFTEEKRPDLMLFFFLSTFIRAQLLDYNNIPKILMFHSRPDLYFNSEPDCHAEDLQPIYINTTPTVLFDSFIPLLPEFVQRGNIVSIPNGITLQKQFINTDVEHKRIIYLSRVDNCKGLEFLMHSFKLIADKYPDWSIDIYGDINPPKYIKKLTKLLKKLKLTKQIVFKGITNRPIETFLNYDFCVFPSFVEGFGMGLAEALSVGLPAVGLKGCSGVNELIINEYNGFLTEENYLEYANKIELLIKDKQLRKEYSKNAIQDIKRFDKAKLDKQWLHIAENLIKGNSVNIRQKKDATVNNEIFPLLKIRKMIVNDDMQYKFFEYIFSIKNDYKNEVKEKILCILGIKFKLRSKNNA